MQTDSVCATECLLVLAYAFFYLVSLDYGVMMTPKRRLLIFEVFLIIDNNRGEGW